MMTDFQQNESEDGYATSGSYRVTLPDGRVQTVKYVDNGDEGENDNNDELLLNRTAET